MISRLTLPLAVFWLIVSVPAVVADEAPKPPEGLNLLPPGPSTDPVDGVNFARKLIKRKNFEGAAALLETIYEQQPDNSTIVNLLRNCYLQLGHFGKAELLVRRLIEKSPEAYINHVFLAEALSRQGKTDDARAAYDAASDQVVTWDTTQYLVIIRSMRKHAFDSEALSLISALREQAADSTAFAFEAGCLLEGQRQYAEATGEFFVALSDSARAGIEAENKLLSMLNFEASSAVVEDALLSQVGAAPRAKAARILSAYYLQAGRTQEALRFAFLQDSLQQSGGASVLRHLRACRDRMMFEQAVEAGELALAVYGNNAAVDEAYFLYGDALAQLGEYDRAIEVYDQIIERFPRKQDKADAGYRIGNIYLNDLHEYEAALAMFDSVVTNYRAGAGWLQCLTAIPHCHLRQGDFQEAQRQFEKLLPQRLNDDTYEKTYYYLALLKFFDEEYDSCQAALNRLVVDYPRGYYVNDALQLLLLIEEATQAPHLLKRLGEAIFYEERQWPDSVRAALEHIAGDDKQVLADVALYRLSQVCLEQIDSAAALAFIGELIDRFPESYYLPYGLKMKADILLADPVRQEEGRQIYRRLLEDHPNYPFISEVRKRLRELEVDAHTG